jgi:putative methanogenesis marker protein 12
MFLGIEHGTQAIRFAFLDGKKCRIFELNRKEAASLSGQRIADRIESGLQVKLHDITLTAMTYGMGDAINRIMDIKSVKNRGIRGPAGKQVGGGANVFDTIKDSGIPAVLLPGIHSDSPIDARMKFFSHVASAEKLGLCHYIGCLGHRNFIVSDVGSSAVTVGVAGGKVVGGIDACIFSPGIVLGPLDLQAIRDVDAGLTTADDAFSSGGILKLTSFNDVDKLLGSNSKDAKEALRILSLFVSMEMAAMEVLIKNASLFLAGAAANRLRKNIEKTLQKKVTALGKYAAAEGCAMVARDVFLGAKDILGVGIDFKIRGGSQPRR